MTFKTNILIKNLPHSFQPNHRTGKIFFHSISDLGQKYTGAVAAIQPPPHKLEG